MVIPRGYFFPICIVCKSTDSYWAVFIITIRAITTRAIAQLPPIVQPPGIEFIVFVDRQAVVTPRGYFFPIRIICSSADSYWFIFLGTGTIAQSSKTVKPPGVEFTSLIDHQVVVMSRREGKFRHSQLNQLTNFKISISDAGR